VSLVHPPEPLEVGQKSIGYSEKRDAPSSLPVETITLTSMMSQLCEQLSTFSRVLTAGTSPLQSSSESNNVQMSEPSGARTAQSIVSSGPNEIRDKLPLSADSAAAGVELNNKTRNVMKPQQFDGKEPVNSFLAHFEVCAEFNQWSDLEKRSWLRWSLKGRAQQML